MSAPQVHQLLHGYRNGHELLAGSVKLSAPDAELVARLSDLSGTLQSDVKFSPYVTVYPLPSGTYYAIARTWLDKHAPRSGCVLTRTALIEMRDWQNGHVLLQNVLNALSSPTREDVSPFQRPLTIEPASPHLPRLPAPLPEVEVFTAKYFGEGIRPVVWFRDDAADQILLSISRVLWPQLRRRFAACTLSLQPRNLTDAPFDLLFAPTAVYSRFTKIPRENLIDTSTIAKSRQKSEEWIIDLTELIYASGPLPVPSTWPALSNTLNADPTSIRWLYLLNDLRQRTRSSPTAALGAMDVVERLCPETGSESELKETVAGSALTAAGEIDDTREALSFLQLVSERLSHAPYAEIGGTVLNGLRSQVRRRASKHPDQALAAYEELMARTSLDDAARRSFRMGLIDSLTSLGEARSAELIALHQFDAAANDIVPSQTSIGHDYLMVPSNEPFAPSRDVVRWLQHSPVPVDWDEWAAMLASIHSDDVVDDKLFGECFTRLSERQISVVLSAISDFGDRTSLAVAIEKYLVPTAPRCVRQWALSQRPASTQIARIASSTYERSSAGLKELLDDESADRTVLNNVLVQFLSGAFYGHLASWFSDAFDLWPELIVRLLEAVSVNVDRAEEVLARILRELDVLPLPAVERLLPKVESMGGRAIADDLCRVVVQTMVAWTLRGACSAETWRVIDGSPVLSAWVQEVEGSRLANLFNTELAQNRQNYGRAWLVLSQAPDAIYRSRRLASIAIVNLLLRQASVTWASETSDAWRVVLDRAKMLCEPRYYVRHCVQALGFSLENTRLPVSAVVRATFPTVYHAVAEQAYHSDEANSLLSYDWDRAKGLRRNLVDTFYQSKWPEGDLALAAVESFGLRKLFRRVWRKWSGEEYVSRMIGDLRRRDEPLAVRCLNELVSYCEKPNFYEPWD